MFIQKFNVEVKLGGAVAGLEPKNTASRWRRVKDSVAPALKHSLAISQGSRIAELFVHGMFKGSLGFQGVGMILAQIDLSLPTSRMPSNIIWNVIVVSHFGEINGFCSPPRFPREPNVL